MRKNANAEVLFSLETLFGTQKYNSDYAYTSGDCGLKSSKIHISEHFGS